MHEGDRRYLVQFGCSALSVVGRKHRGHHAAFTTYGSTIAPPHRTGPTPPRHATLSEHRVRRDAVAPAHTADSHASASSAVQTPYGVR